MFKKNETVRLRIEDLSSEGLGIGHSEGVAVFVKDTVIGDEVEAIITKVKKTYAFGRLVQVLTPSAYRTIPRCPVARQCGGCQLQMMDYEAQLSFKHGRVKNALERIGGFADIPVEPVLGMEEPWNYRNKAQYPVGTGRDGVTVCGFYAGRTHAIIPVPKDGCAISAVSDQEILSIVTAHMQQYHIPAYNEAEHSGLIRHVLIRSARSTGQIMVCLIVNGEKLPGEADLVQALCTIPGMTTIAFNRNSDRTNVILGKETRTLFGPGYIVEQIGAVRYRISVRSFFQVNPQQTEKLYSTALEYASPTGEETVLDLYCGTGTISLFLAQKARKVYGIEIIEEAVADARINAQENDIRNAQFFAGQAEKVLPELYREGSGQADVIVVDPPRKGCERAVLDTMLLIAPQRIVYVSCDPATLARDLAILCDRTGYQVLKVQPVDMFPHTAHVETVVLMSRIQG